MPYDTHDGMWRVVDWYYTNETSTITGDRLEAVNVPTFDQLSVRSSSGGGRAARATLRSSCTSHSQNR